MSYLVLARKYRPQTFEEVVGQEHVTQTLANAILTQRVAHAILFAGPRGTGKTTVARILAKAMNCETGPTPRPCGECGSCTEIASGRAPDVLEIDGASNNGVEQIRELRENVKYMPAHSPHKIYVIDEVHMLSIAAFNALLKTLEEPPAHVLFLFATTEPQKIPITILSRCQRHDLRRISLEAIVRHMLQLCESEGVSVERETLAIIAREGAGSMRDSLSLLDHVIGCSDGEILTETVLNILGIVDRGIIFALTDAVMKGDVTEALELLHDTYVRGYDMKKVYGDVLEHFRNLVVTAAGNSKIVDASLHEIEMMEKQIQGKSLAFLNQLFDMLFRHEHLIRLSADPKLAFETVLIKFAEIKPLLAFDTLIEKLDRLKGSGDTAATGGMQPLPSAGTQPRPTHATAATAVVQPQASVPTQTAAPKPAAVPAQEKKQPEPARHEKPPDIPRERKNSTAGMTKEEIWNKILEVVSKNLPAAASVLKKSRLTSLSDTGVIIEVTGSRFTVEQAKRGKNIDAVSSACVEVLGRSVNVKVEGRIETNGGEKKNLNQLEKIKKDALNHPCVEHAMDVFNGEVKDVKIL